jgi:Camelysin metallo-endopeptidase
MTSKRTAERPARKSGTGKLFGSLVAVALVGLVGFVGTRAAISDTTDNPGNQFNAGAIDLVDNDAGQYMYQVNNVQPGDSISHCIRVSYTGTLDSTVKLFMGTPIDALGPYVDLTVDAGTQASSSFPNCTGFVSTGNLYTGTLSAFQTAHPDVANGLAYSPNGASPWTDGDSVVYRVTLTLQNTARNPGEDFSGTHTYSWQADTV